MIETESHNKKPARIEYQSIPAIVSAAFFCVALAFVSLIACQMLPNDERIAPSELGAHEYRVGNSPALILARIDRALTQTTRASVPRPSVRDRSWHPSYSGYMESASSRAVLSPFVLNLVFAFLALLNIFIGWKLKDSTLRIDESGLCFPNGMMPELDWRRKRKWTELGALRYLPENAKQQKGKKMQFYFDSGGSATLCLDKLERGNLEKLFEALDLYAPQLKCSPELLSLRHELRKAAGKVSSYTKLWESELALQHSATNFVTLKPESRLQNDRLKVIMHLSSGGLSAVYLAELNGKAVVLKESVLPPACSEAQKQKAEELFQREASMLMKLEHQQIAKVLDSFRENGRDYMLLEYIPGVTLRDYVRKHGPQSEQRVLDWTLQIASILDYLHSQDPPILHRDLTPDNLIIQPNGKVVLIDFGAANHFLGTATGTIIGKQFYISPEQLRGKAGPESDIYSLGATMFYLLTGNDPDALKAARPVDLNQSISPFVNGLVESCTALALTERVSSARDLIEIVLAQKNASDCGADAVTSNLDGAKSRTIEEVLAAADKDDAVRIKLAEREKLLR